MNIIKLAFDMAEAVQNFFGKTRRFYYLVMLLGHRCPKCNSALTMTAESLCRCNSCEFEFDPTVKFQRCSACGGVPVLRVRRYYCKACGSEVISKFVFDTLPFERQYFKGKMAESRRRKKERLERVRKMLAESHSGELPLETVNFSEVPDLVDVLNKLTTGMDTTLEIEPNSKFDLKRYQSHIKAHIQDFAISLSDIPPLSESRRKELIWRFIAVIFLAHTGIVDIWQDGRDIMVTKHETNAEGQGVFGELEETDRIEGFVDRVEA